MLPSNPCWVIILHAIGQHLQCRASMMCVFSNGNTTDRRFVLSTPQAMIKGTLCGGWMGNSANGSSEYPRTSSSYKAAHPRLRIDHLVQQAALPAAPCCGQARPHRSLLIQRRYQGPAHAALVAQQSQQLQAGWCGAGQHAILHRHPTGTEPVKCTGLVCRDTGARIVLSQGQAASLVS